MEHRILKLKDINKLIKSEATLELILPVFVDVSGADISSRDCVLICPGGAYAYCSNREADPVAVKFLNMGYICAILRYTCAKQDDINPLFPMPQLDALAAIKFLRENYKDLRIKEDGIHVIGFSAGGHLAGSLGYLNKNKNLLEMINAKEEEVKINSLCLCYPVVTMTSNTHGGSCDNLTKQDETLKELLSIEKHINKDYPKTYIWTTEDDNAVPSINSKLLIEALAKANVEHDWIIYPHGLHGLSTADLLCNVPENCDATIALWPQNFVKFLKKL